MKETLEGVIWQDGTITHHTTAGICTGKARISAQATIYCSACGYETIGE